MKMVYLVKFMKKEELVDMYLKIRNPVNPINGKRHHGNRIEQYQNFEEYERRRGIGAFNMNNFDFVDPLINEFIKKKAP